MGGGTLDVAIANCLNGKVDVIAHGGIAMCGGADIDRRIVDNVIKPWLLDNGDYNIPKDFIKIPKYQKLLQRARYRAEEAKINLSSEEETTIEGTLGPDITDENGEEIELDIDFSREDLNAIIRDIADEAVTCARETIQNPESRQLILNVSSLLEAHAIISRYVIMFRVNWELKMMD